MKRANTQHCKAARRCARLPLPRSPRPRWSPMAAKAATTVTIATLNNPDMIELKKLSPAFEKANPDIQLKWVILEENVLRQRATTDITTNSGQFDVMAIGTYEAPQWGKRGWLAPMTNLPADYDLERRREDRPRRPLVQRPVVRAAVLRRKLDDVLPQGPVPGGRPEDARPADLRPDQAIRRQAHRQGQGPVRHLPARQGGLGREHGVRVDGGEHVRRPLVRRELECPARHAGVAQGGHASTPTC